MKKNKNNNPSVLDSVSSIFNTPEVSNPVTDVSDTILNVDRQTEDVPDPAKQEPEVNNNQDVDPNGNDHSDIPQEVLDRMNGKTNPAQGLDNPDNQDDPNNNNNNPDDNNHDQQEPHTPDQPDSSEPSDADVAEAQAVSTLFDALIESFGYNPSDIDDDKKPVTADGLTDYIKQVVAQNSQPQYADDRIAQLDTYVKNGGNFEDFYQIQQQQMNLENIDLENEENQKAVVRELLQRDGYSTDKINRRIERFEDADMLEEEAQDALDRLKELDAQELQQREQQQAAYQEQQAQQAQAFFQDVTSQITNMTNIRGINVPKEDRAALYDYIFRTDANGLTQYQKDFNKNLSKNLIESAYFTMKGDALLSEAQRDGQTSAAKKLREMLRGTKNHTRSSIKDEKQPQAWDIASKYL